MREKPLTHRQRPDYRTRPPWRKFVRPKAAAGAVGCPVEGPALAECGRPASRN